MFGWITNRRGREGKAGSIFATMPELFRHASSKTGEVVNWRNALDVTTVLAAVRVISQGIAQVPIQFLTVDSNGNKTPVRSHPLLGVLGRKPNAYQTSFQFRQTVMVHLLLTGNAFVFKNLVGPERRVAELLPISPNRVTVRHYPDGTMDYLIAPEAAEASSFGATIESQGTGARKVLPAEAVWHLRGLSWNGWMGLEVVRLAREAIGLAMATEGTHARLHANQAKPGGLYSVDGTLSAEQYKQIAAWLQTSTSGDNAWRPMILDRGAKWTPLQTTGVDNQHLETRRFQIEEICRALGVIPMMVGYSDKTATYASAEQMFIAHVVHTLAPWARNFEESAQAELLSPNDETDIELDFNALMRGASKDRAEYNAKALGSGGHGGWMTPNEVRRAEGLPPAADGDELPKPAAAGKAPVDSTPTDHTGTQS